MDDDNTVVVDVESASIILPSEPQPEKYQTSLRGRAPGPGGLVINPTPGAIGADGLGNRYWRRWWWI